MVDKTPAHGPILTIGIPTWNRSGKLKQLLGNLVAHCPIDAAAKIEVIVSDNASVDDTEEIVASIAAAATFPIRYRRNDRNLGAVLNVLETLKAARGRYWAFYGDDDEITCENLPEILRLLSADAAPLVAVFRGDPCLPPYCFEQREDLTAAEAAHRLFYYIGNAGRFAVRTKAAQDAFDLLPNRGWSCWPQTEIVFVSLVLTQETLPVHVEPLVSARIHHRHNTAYTAYHLAETPMLALYRAAARIRPLVGDEIADAGAASAMSWEKVRGRLPDIFYYKTLSDLRQDVRAFRRVTTRTLAAARPGFLRSLAVLWLLAHSPRWLDRLGLWVYLAARFHRGARIQYGNLAAAYPRERRLLAAQSPDVLRAHSPRDLDGGC